MLVKKKSLVVISISGTLIGLVLIITLLGVYIYLNIKEENDKNTYQEAIKDTTAQLFSDQVEITGIRLKLGEDREFKIKDKPVFEGGITNNSGKKILLLKIKISVVDKNNKVIYSDFFIPIRQSSILSVIPSNTGQYLAPGNAVSFQHILNNCPKDLLAYLKMKNKFVKERGGGKFELTYKIEELIVG